VQRLRARRPSGSRECAFVYRARNRRGTRRQPARFRPCCVRGELRPRGSTTRGCIPRHQLEPIPDFARQQVELSGDRNCCGFPWWAIAGGFLGSGAVAVNPAWDLGSVPVHTKMPYCESRRLPSRSFVRELTISADRLKPEERCALRRKTGQLSRLTSGGRSERSRRGEPRERALRCSSTDGGRSVIVESANHSIFSLLAARHPSVTTSRICDLVHLAPARHQREALRASESGTVEQRPAAKWQASRGGFRHRSAP